MMTYSLDFRARVLKIKAIEGLSFAEVAQRFRVGINSVVRWSKNLAPKKTRNKGAGKLDMEALKRDIITYNDSFQYERAKRLGVSKSCIHFALKRLGVTYKKNSKASQNELRKTLCFLPDNPTISG